MMNPEIKQKWVDALATYKQGSYLLRKDDEFCCLGVLCDIYAKETGVEWERRTYINTYFSIEGQVERLPGKVIKWAGLESEDPVVYIDGKNVAPLTTVNDGLGYTFPQITRLIQEQL